MAKRGWLMWIPLASGLLGLVAALLLIFSRSYELQKAQVEAARAKVEYEQQQQRDRTANAAFKAASASVIKAEEPTTRSDDLASARRPPASHTLPDSQRVQGIWRCVREQSTGKEWTKVELAATDKRLEVAADQLTISRTVASKRVIVSGRLTFLPNAEPKRFELRGTNEKGVAIWLAGVSVLTPDRFRLCYRAGSTGAAMNHATWADVNAEGVVWVEFEKV